ncbi:hypothetical protein [Streptomyces spinosirectus]
MDNDVMTRWFRSYGAEEETWLYFGVGADGWVTRQVELHGPLEQPVAAASSAEWTPAQQDGSLAVYEAMFGATTDVPVHGWDAHEPHAVTAGQFKAVWGTARAICRARARAARSRDGR